MTMLAMLRNFKVLNLNSSDNSRIQFVIMTITIKIVEAKISNNQTHTHKYTHTS